MVLTISYFLVVLIYYFSIANSLYQMPGILEMSEKAFHPDLFTSPRIPFPWRQCPPPRPCALISWNWNLECKKDLLKFNESFTNLPTLATIQTINAKFWRKCIFNLIDTQFWLWKLFTSLMNPLHYCIAVPCINLYQDILVIYLE